MSLEADIIVSRFVSLLGQTSLTTIPRSLQDHVVDLESNVNHSASVGEQNFLIEPNKTLS